MDFSGVTFNFNWDSIAARLVPHLMQPLIDALANNSQLASALTDAIMPAVRTAIAQSQRATGDSTPPFSGPGATS